MFFFPPPGLIQKQFAGKATSTEWADAIPQPNQLQKAKAQQPGGTPPAHHLRISPDGEAGSHNDNAALSQPPIEQTQAVSSGDSEQLDEEADKDNNIFTLKLQTVILNFCNGDHRNGFNFKVDKGCYDPGRETLTIDVLDEIIQGE